MRFVALALIAICLPLFISLLRTYPRGRPRAFATLGFLLFLGGAIRLDTFIIAWPLWNGTVRGLEVSPADMLALALIATRVRGGPRTPFWGVIILWASSVWLSLLVSAVPMATFFACWQSLRMMILFAAVAGEVHRDDMRRGLLTGFAMGLVLQAGYVLQQKASGVVQAVGTVGHQNTLGMMVELAVLPLLGAALGGDRRKVVLLGIGAALVVVAGGGSRATLGIAGAGCATLVLLSLIRGSTPAKMKILGLSVLALMVVIPFALATLNHRFGNAPIIAEDTERLAFERAALAMAADHPLGVGANLYVSTANVKGYAQRAGVAWNFANRSAPVHNVYLLARAETGWFGELAFIILLTVILLRGLRFAFQKRWTVSGEAALGSAVAIATNALHNNYEFASYTYFVAAPLFVNFGIVAAQIRSGGLARRKRAPKPRPHMSQFPVSAGSRAANLGHGASEVVRPDAWNG